jgi:NADH-quinone oxidoreductase subunit H
MLVFLVKTLVLVNVIIWIRWTLPRIRVDQMMNLCWKYLVPAAFACLVFTLGWQLLVGATGGSGAGFMSVAETVSGVALFAIACLLLFRFLALTRKNIDAVVGDRIDLTNW